MIYSMEVVYTIILKNKQKDKENGKMANATVG
jgi:hypothetical protein